VADQPAAALPQSRSASRSVVQPVAPAAAFLGLSSEAWAVAGSVAEVVGTAGSAAASVISRVDAGDSGVGSMLLPKNLVTDQDKLKLQQVLQFKIVNLYVERYLAAHPDVAQQLRAPTSAPSAPAASGATSPPASGSNPPGAGDAGRPTGAPTGQGVDAAVLAIVRTSVERALVETLDEGKRSSNREFMWGEDDTRGQGRVGGSGSAEMFGVTGFLQFHNVEGVTAWQNLSLSNDARLAVGSLPDEGKMLQIHKVFGGSMGGRVTWSATDDLAVNVEGGVQESVGKEGAPKLIIRTRWHWDRVGPDDVTFMEVTIDWPYNGEAEFTAIYDASGF
jgi:hypothetical protein